jgi:hypothetical protein
MWWGSRFVQAAPCRNGLPEPRHFSTIQPRMSGAGSTYG